MSTKDDKAPTTAQIREKVAEQHPQENPGSEVAAAQLGTDAEAAGHPPSAEARKHAEEQIEKHAPDKHKS